MIWLIILVRIVANPFSNVFQKVLTKRNASPLFIIALGNGLMAVVCVPFFVRWAPHQNQTFWINIWICAFLATAGNTLLVEAVKRADLSVLGPINAYKSVVSLIPAAVLLHEYPGKIGLMGIGLIVAGSYLVVDRDISLPKKNAFFRFFEDRGIQFRFAALIFSATEAVYLKKAMLAANAYVAFVFWVVLGLAVSSVVPLVFEWKRIGKELRILGGEIGVYLLLASTTFIAQLTTFIALGAVHVSYALALFQTSTLLTVILGWRIFREKNIVERLAGSIVMIGGALLIIYG